MSSPDQIRESIEARLAELNTELNTELASLQAARAALEGEQTISTAAAASTNSTAQRRRRRTPNLAGTRRDGAPPTTTTDGGRASAAAAAPGQASKRSTVPAPTPRRRTQTKPAKTNKPVEVLPAGKLEAMLREAEDGLSAVTISKRSSAGYNQVLGLLRKLESAGQVRRTGTRRTTLWRLITDEERIAQRAAELETRIAKSGSPPVGR
jgi:hypothetical protein